MIASVRKMPSVITSRDFPNPLAARNNQSNGNAADVPPNDQRQRRATAMLAKHDAASRASAARRG
jgi:hypothetical protein